MILPEPLRLFAFHRCDCVTVLAILILPLMCKGDSKSKQIRMQYNSPGIQMPAATEQEAKVVEFGRDSMLAAAKYLDDGALAWTREKSCIACHTTGVYMADRTELMDWLGKPAVEVRDDFADSVPDGDPKPKMRNGEMVFSGVVFSIWRSLGLAQWDRHVGGTLSEPTRRSLRDTLLRQSPDGFWPTVNKIEIPHTTTRFELGVQAARAIAAAPGWLDEVEDVELRRRVDRLREALRNHEVRNDYERALQLQLANVMPDLVASSVLQEAKERLWQLQNEDGGWSTRDMSGIDDWGDKMRPETRAMLAAEPDATDPESDPYMTAFAIVLLRQSGIPTNNPGIQRGLNWLKSNQRVSGRWWMKSLYKDTYHYSTYLATAQALKALALCDELPVLGKEP